MHKIANFVAALDAYREAGKELDMAAADARDGDSEYFRECCLSQQKAERKLGAALDALIYDRLRSVIYIPETREEDK